MTSNVKRFGEFNLKLNRPPEPWIKDSVFQQAAGSLRINTTRQADTEKATLLTFLPHLSRYAVWRGGRRRVG